jgi:hypothetical protein
VQTNWDSYVSAIVKNLHYRVREIFALTALTALGCLYLRWLIVNGVGFDEIPGLFWIWFLHAVFGFVLSAPIAYFGRKRVDWHFLDLLVFVLPFGIWASLIFSELGNGKSMANLVEPFYFAFFIPLTVVGRVIIGRLINERLSGWSMTIVMCILAAATFFIVASLPE